MDDNKQMTKVCIAAAVGIVVLMLLNRRTHVVVNCKGGKEEMSIMQSLGEYGPDRLSGPEVRALDPYFNVENMMPNTSGADMPEWVKKFEKGDNMLLQQNFIDTTDTERFQVTRSVCGRRYMSRDLRRTPTVTRDPRTVSSFGLPVINPECALEENSLHPGLD